MKKKSPLFVFIICLLQLSSTFSTQLKGATNYSFQFQIKGLDIPEKCILGYYQGDFTYVIDSVNVSNGGKLSFKGQRDLATGLYFLMIPNKGVIDFIVHDENQFQIKSDISNLKKNLSVKGSIENKAYFDYLSFLETKREEIQQQQQMLNMIKRATKDPQVIQENQQRINSLHQSIAIHAYELMDEYTTTFFCMMMEANELPEVPSNIPVQVNNQTNPIYLQYVKDHFWDNFDFNEAGLLQTKIFPAKANLFFERLTAPSVEGVIESVDILAQKSKANKTMMNNTLRWLVTKFEDTKNKGTDAVFVHIFDTYFTSPEKDGIDVATFSRVEQKANYFRPVLAGKIAPNIKLLDQYDKPQSLHQLKAKYTLLYFFSPLCDKCRVATPKVAELFKKYEAKGLKGFAVCTDDKKAYWKNYVKENKLPWTCVIDTDDDLTVESQYAPNSLPSIFILDKDKRIFANRLEFEALDGALKALIQ